MQMEISKRFKEEYLEFFGQEIPIGGHTNIFISRASLLSNNGLVASTEISNTFKRFRTIGLTSLPLHMKVRLALLSRGVSERGLGIFLLIIVDRFMQFEEELGPQCIVVKMLNSIRLSISTSKIGVMQKFFNQGKIMNFKVQIQPK